MPAEGAARRALVAGGWLLAGLAAAPQAAIAADAAPASGSSTLPSAQAGVQPGTQPAWPVRGQATLRFLGLAIYDATLSAPAGFSPQAWAARPLALTLHYHRSLRGEAIVERSLQEMRRGGTIDASQAARWLAFMTAALPDVRAGDLIVGHWWPAAGQVSLQVNDSAPQALVDAEFGARFFGIWLAPHTSEPALRARLLGLP